MKSYLIDTNFYLRYLLKDDIHAFETVSEYVDQARKLQIELIFLPQVLFEIEYVLRKVYKIHRAQISSILSEIVFTPYITIIDREIIESVVLIFQRKHIDLVDILLTVVADKQKAEILTFDKELIKLKNIV